MTEEELEDSLARDTRRYIVKLEAEIERLQELLRGTGANRYWEGRWRDEAKDNERLRAALQSLTHDPPRSLAREPDTDCEVVLKMRAIARSAMEPKP